MARHARWLLAILFLVPAAMPAQAYSLLTHEQLIDLTWTASIAPLLLRRYPGLSAEQLERARAYAYGGCAIQDIGYYPFGDIFFSELTHYVRTGDFVAALFREARDANQLAFAVGALSHYIGDSVGHSEATNLSVPVEFPKLRAIYGPVVTYGEDVHAHVQTEFAYDINEIAHHRLAPLAYLRHIGLRVPTAQLSAAFYETYGLGESFNKTGRKINVRGYRFSVHTFIPRVAYALTVLHRSEMPADAQNADFFQMEKEFERVEAEENWARYRKRPGFITYSLAGLIYILPKLGPLKDTSIKGPNESTEEDYVRSVNRSTDALRAALAKFGGPRPGLPNRDLDTGAVTRPGGYKLTDETYAKLLHRLAAHPQAAIPPGVKQDVLNYYADPDAPILTKMYPAQWAQVEADLAILQRMQVADAAPRDGNE